MLATLEPDEFQATLQMNTTFLRPVRPGPLVGRGRLLRRDGDIAAVEAELVVPGGETAAVATATCQVIPLAEARGAV